MVTVVRPVVGFGLLALGVFAGSCAIEDSHSGEDRYDDIGALPPELRAELEAFCAWWAELDCSLSAEVSPHQVNAEHCVPTHTATCVGGFIPRVALSLAEGRLVYHPESRAVVEKDLRRLREGSFTEREALESWRSLFQGTVENGEPCHQANGYWFYVNECADGFCPWGDCPGTCRPFPGPDDECDWSENPCQPSEYCDDGCKQHPGEGDACDPNGVFCLPPFRCLGTADGAGTCGLALELGEACALTSDCALGACRDGVCSLSAVDEPCESSSECDAGLSCIDLRCAPRRSEREACQADRDCTGEFQCLHVEFAGSCAEPLAIGDGCHPYQSCPKGLVCKGWNGFGTCEVPGIAGESCTSESCLGGTYCSGWEFESRTEGTCRESPVGTGCDPTP